MSPRPLGVFAAILGLAFFASLAAHAGLLGDLLSGGGGFSCPSPAPECIGAFSAPRRGDIPEGS